MIILFGSQKGGVGKSTIATNVATELARRGHDVMLVDCDPQKTASNWAQRRAEAGMEPAVHIVEKTGNVRATALDLAERYDYVIMDAGGHDNQALRTALTAADIIYTPTRPSQADLETMGFMSELIQTARDFNPGLAARAVISLAPTNPMINEAKEAQEFLGEFLEDMPLSKVFIRDRKVYREAMLLGCGVVEGDNSKAKAEIQLLVQEILEHGKVCAA